MYRARVDSMVPACRNYGTPRRDGRGDPGV